jgi:hypothetical protein
VKAAVALELGECLRDFGDFSDALRYLRMAANASGEHEQEIKKQALWQAIGICTRVKLQRLAQRYMDALDAIDPRYGELVAGH